MWAIPVDGLLRCLSVGFMLQQSKRVADAAAVFIGKGKRITCILRAKTASAIFPYRVSRFFIQRVIELLSISKWLERKVVKVPTRKLAAMVKLL